ncbi:Arc family DNA-binding protein [Salmonella enterica]|nr:Arc family DNA-binding protein [Salmonella enterica subsp. enterica serovar Abony]EFT5364485.1 Arc family DNA-binding protein [Salmonella enterica]HCM2972782.1 Arc family DNA-binding protein [Salmonella enterica subsp. enterica serovar Coeln]HDH3855099.1 Arc family DNA-binding protein [Salmonella enterica subsp. enterica serovar Oranienburg]EEU8799658.1 Arc family DNA-binding protein [Salmonella enterica subsp. enterica serovar Abony]
MKKSDEHLQFKLRIPRKLAEELKRTAEKNMRSVNAEILFRLAQNPTT